jgi:P27 family predicted phage terminase small subunit
MATRNAPKTTAPPAYLSAATRAWWRQLAADYELESHDFRVLEVACLAWDRLQQARRDIAKVGLRIDGPKGPCMNPSIRIEADSQVRFLRAVRELQLDAPPPDPRPAPLRGYQGRV